MDRVQYIHDTLIKTNLLNNHHSDVIMSAMSQITGVSIAYSTVFSGADKKNHQSSASLVFVGEVIGDRWISLTKGQ